MAYDGRLKVKVILGRVDRFQRDYEMGNSCCFRFQPPVPGYQMGGYHIRAPGFVLYPYVFVEGPNKHDCSRHTRQRGKF
jgi:hypothetical protein